MGRELSLLKRLQHPEAGLPRTTKQNTRLLADSILDNLRRLLNVHQGDVPILPDYGIPGILDITHAFPDNIAAFQQAIRSTIEKYEPRLRNVRVKYVEAADDPMRLHFEITAQLSTSAEKASLRFETAMDPMGRVEVSG